MKLLITDLDNTLYDWVTFYSESFRAMSKALSEEINVPLDNLLDEYKAVHQKFGNSEKPFATLELPSVISHFKSKDKVFLQQQLSNVFAAFSKKRNETLKLYPEVLETLKTLKNNGVRIVAHTEALEFNALYRIHKLGLLEVFDHLYTQEDTHNLHPEPESAKKIQVADNFIIRLPLSQAKPNPQLLKSICDSEGVSVNEAIYIGDSLTKDIAMAKEAGVTALWANYGRTFSPSCWDILVRITHWTDSDVKREEELKKAYSDVKPDHTIDEFSELLRFM